MYIETKGDQAFLIGEDLSWLFDEGEAPEPTITPITITKIDRWQVYYRIDQEPDRLYCHTPVSTEVAQALKPFVREDLLPQRPEGMNTSPRRCARCGRTDIDPARDPARDEMETEWLMMMTGLTAQHLDHVRPVD